MANAVEYINFRYPCGTKLLVELADGDMYEGSFHHLCNSRLFLCNAVKYPLPLQKKDFFIINILEIVSITVIEENPDDPSKIAKELFEKSKTLARNYEYISLPDGQYFDAIKELRSSSEIAIWGFGSSKGRTEKIYVFGVATRNKIYLFDMRRKHPDSAFSLGLQEVLEDRTILKIVHDSKTLADCLWHQHKVRMENVYDTQIGDYMLTPNETNETPRKMLKLSECIYKYLKIPKCVLLDTENLCPCKLRRPLYDSTKEKASLLVTLLYFLKYGIQSVMLSNYNKTVNCYMNCLKDLPNINPEYLTNSVPEEVQNLNLQL